jgi:hypothetical protein
MLLGALHHGQQHAQRQRHPDAGKKSLPPRHPFAWNVMSKCLRCDVRWRARMGVAEGSMERSMEPYTPPATDLQEFNKNAATAVPYRRAGWDWGFPTAASRVRALIARSREALQVDRA